MEKTLSLAKRLLLQASMSALALSSQSAFALQIIDASDGVAAEAVISIKEPTRIRIDGAAITDVFGNIYSSTCGASASSATSTAPRVNPSGEIILECDKDKGEIYVRPVGPSRKPVNLFVSSQFATYTLLLKRSDTPSDTILVRDRTPRQLRADKSASSDPTRAALHIRSIKAMLVAMATERIPPDVRVEEVNRPVKLWVETRFSLMRQYEGRNLVGEKYLLTNTGGNPMVLAEQEFDREHGAVLAVAIENHNLRPGDSTNVYIIRRGN